MFIDDDDDDDNLISMEAKQCRSAGSIGVCFDVKWQFREPTRTFGPLLQFVPYFLYHFLSLPTLSG